MVQKYVADPMTVGGKKFDMRIYVLVTSWSPLEVRSWCSFVCRGGRVYASECKSAVH